MQLQHTVAALCVIGAMGVGARAQLKLPDAPEAGSEQVQQISAYVREVYQDRDGHFWFGTNGDGVCRYDGETLTYLSVREGFGGRAVRGILQDEAGAMWFATDGGVSRFQDGAFTNYTVANGLSNDSVWSLMRDRAGTIWAGTHEGVCRFDGEGFVPFALPRVEVEHPESRFSPLVVFAMYEDPAGDLWFGTDGEGAHRYDGESFTSYTTKEGLGGNMVRSIAGDRRGRVWIGSDGGGVSCYDGTGFGAGFRTFTAKDGLCNDRVYEILEDRAGNMWFSTLGAGACRYDGNSFAAFGVAQGLTRSHVQEFFEDRDGVLWLGCSGGLFRLEGEAFVNVTRDGPWPAPARGQEPGGAGVADPMASFARMAGGEWRMTAPGMTARMFDTWHWGPGRRSMMSQVYGTGADGKPWRELLVVYWHPGLKEVRLLGLHLDIPGLGRGVMEGAIRFDGESAEAEFDLHQPGHPGRAIRKMGLRWAFDGPDRYHETLLEDSGAGLALLAEWDFARSGELSALPTVAAEAKKASEHLKVFESLVGHTWEAGGDRGAGDAAGMRTTFEWIPYVDAIYARSLALAKDGEFAHVLDAYIYLHAGTKALRCLALSDSGGVYEGGATVLEGGGLRLDLKGYEGDRSVEREVRIDLEGDGTLRQRLWSVEGGERTLVLDVRHTKMGVAKD